jgi:hypothetical protein
MGVDELRKKVPDSERKGKEEKECVESFPLCLCGMERGWGGDRY